MASKDNRTIQAFRYWYLALLGGTIALLCSFLSPESALSQVQGWPLPDSPQLSYASRPIGSNDSVVPLGPGIPLGTPFSRADTSDTFSVSGNMFPCIVPPISNLELGWLYTFGKKVRTGRASADYLLPLVARNSSVLFAEAHGEYQSYWKQPIGGTNHRIDLSFGGGYRTMPTYTTLVGVNAFHDSSKIFGKWYSSGSVGVECTKLFPRCERTDAFDLNFNWYGELFTSDVIRNAFRGGPENFDVEAGFSHELGQTGPDLRVKVTGYQFNAGDLVRGWNAGLELKSRNGMFSVRYDVGNDKINDTYQTVGAFFNAGVRLENILRGKSPFAKPEPIFHSPRNLRHMFTQKVRRDWHQNVAAILNHTSTSGGPGCDRTLASIPMTSAGSGTYVRGAIVTFPAMPYTSLDPSKFIVVEFDYAFDAPPPATVRWRVLVGTAVANWFDDYVPTSQSGHLAFTLNLYGSPVTGQSAFTNSAVDPDQIGDIFAVGATGTTTLTITNVCIRFNQ